MNLKKNNLYSITDILISVDATYQDYNKKLSPDIKKKKMNKYFGRTMR